MRSNRKQETWSEVFRRGFWSLGYFCYSGMCISTKVNSIGKICSIIGGSLATFKKISITTEDDQESLLEPEYILGYKEIKSTSNKYEKVISSIETIVWFYLFFSEDLQNLVDDNYKGFIEGSAYALLAITKLAHYFNETNTGYPNFLLDPCIITVNLGVAVSSVFKEISHVKKFLLISNAVAEGLSSCSMFVEKIVGTCQQQSAVSLQC